MTKKGPTLTPADAREILERAIWLARQDEFAVPTVEGQRRAWDRDPAEEHLESAQAAMLRAAARLACLAGDVTLLPLVIRAYHLHGVAAEFDFEGAGAVEAFAVAIEWLLQLGAPVDADVRALAKAEDGSVRLALIRGLHDAAAEFEPLLRSLADDPEAQVRAAAKEALAAIGAPAWWVGVFSVDPAAVLSDEEAHRISGIVGRYTEIVNMPYGAHKVEDELFDLIDQLPDVLARDACLRWLQRDRWMDRETRLAERMARIPGTLKDVVGLLTQGDTYTASQFARGWASGYVGDREGAAREVLALILERDPTERKSSRSVAWGLTELVRRLWPPGSDAADLVEQVLASPVEDEDRIVWFDAFDSCVDSVAGSSPATIASAGARMVAAFLDGDPRRECKRLRNFTEKSLAALPLEERRAAARRAVASANDDVARWGLRQLLVDAHDTERDPPAGELAERLGADPRLRHMLASDQQQTRRFRAQVLGWVHTGQLDVETAADAIANLGIPLQTVRDELLFGHMEELNVKMDPWGPPLGDEDFEALARLRDASAAEPAYQVLMALPNRPLSPADRAYVDRALAAWKAGNERLGGAIVATLTATGTAEDLPTVEQIVGRDEEPDSLRRLIERMKNRLGLIPKRQRGSAPKAEPSGDDGEKEWMDEDD